MLTCWNAFAMAHSQAKVTGCALSVRLAGEGVSGANGKAPKAICIAARL